MRDEGEGGHEEDEHGGAVLGVPVDLPGNPDQAEEAGRLQQADQRRRLNEKKKTNTRRISKQLKKQLYGKRSWHKLHRKEEDERKQMTPFFSCTFFFFWL